MGELIKALLEQFFTNGFLAIFVGVFGGIGQMFNIPGYIAIIRNYVPEEGNTGMWVVGILMIVLVLAVLIAIVFLLCWGLARLIKRLRAKSGVIDQDLVDEVAELKRQLIKVNMEKDRILGLKISKNGYDISEGYDGEETSDDAKKEAESRFFKLT